MPNVLRVPVAEGVSLHALSWAGDGRRPPFLLVHGLASNCRTWEGVAARLSARGHPVAAVDLRGHGRSDKPDGGYDFATLVSDLRRTTQLLGFERPLVVGQSTGGNLALELAYRAPAEVAGAVGIDGGVLELQDRWPRWEDCRAALAPPPIAGMRADDLEAVLRRRHPGWPTDGIAAQLANCKVLEDGTVRPWLTFDRHIRILRSLWEQRPSALLGDLVPPLLLMLVDSGDEWTAGKRLAADRALATAALVRVAWFSPADHDLHIEQPQEVAGRLLEAVGEGFFPS